MPRNKTDLFVGLPALLLCEKSLPEPVCILAQRQVDLFCRIAEALPLHTSHSLLWKKRQERRLKLLYVVHLIPNSRLCINPNALTWDVYYSLHRFHALIMES